MKKFSLLFLLIFGICVGIQSGAYAELVSGDFTITTEFTTNQNFLIDEKPGYKVTYQLDDENENKYLLKLLVNDEAADIITLHPTNDKTVTKTFEFPVFNEGTHTLKAELLVNGEAVDGEEFSCSYIKSIEAGYVNRGFNTHFSHYTHSAPYGEKDARLLKAIGANTFRDAFYWGTLDKGNFRYNYDNYDMYFESIFKTGLDMVCCLIASHWTTDKLEFDEDGTLLLYQDEHIQKYAEYAVNVAKHYPNITRFEICNEPGFTYTGEQYLKIALAAAKALKEYNPELEIYVGCLIDNDNGVEERLKFTQDFFVKELYPYADAISFHIYTGNQYADAPRYFEQVKDNKEEISAEGGWKELVMTESGWSDDVSEEAWGYVTLEKQATELVKRMVISDSEEIPFVTMYEFRNGGFDTTDSEDNLGILTNDYIPKPSFYSLKEYFKNTNKAQYIGKAYLCDGVTAHAYMADGDYFLVTWAKNTEQGLNIRYDSYIESEYTFDEGVNVTDMFGNRLGNVLVSTYEPKYVHGLSAEFVMNCLESYGTGHIFDELKADLSQIGYSAEDLEAEYLKVCSLMNVSAVEDYVDACYDLCNDIIAEYHKGAISLSEAEFSALLSDLNDVAEYGARLVCLCEDVPDGAEFVDVEAQYNQMSDIIEFSDYETLTYLDEPYKEGKSIIKFLKKYEKNERIIPVEGENFKLDETGNLKIFGKALSNMAAVKVLKGNELIYWDTCIPGEDNEYSADVKLPEMGEYILKINDGNKTEQIVSYSDNGYVSMEDKMTYVGVMRAEKLLEMSKKLMESYLEEKNYSLPKAFKREVFEGREYIVTDCPDSDDISIAAVYDKSGMKGIAVEDENGLCTVDVTDLTSYEIRIFSWENMTTITPRYRVNRYTYSIPQ